MKRPQVKHNTNNMSTTITDLHNGQFQIIDTVANKAWVTTPSENVEQLKRQEDELVRKHQQATDWTAAGDVFQANETAIDGGSMLPIAGTHPDQYLFEFPTNNHYAGTREQNIQRRDVQYANKDYTNNTIIPELETEINVLKEIDDSIGSTPPDGGESTSFDFPGTPLTIAQGTEDATSLPLTVDLETTVTFVQVHVTLDHVAVSKLKISLSSPSGKVVELAYADFGSGTPDSETFGTYQFQEEYAGGDWTLILINDATTQVNTLASASLKLFYG